MKLVFGLLVSSGRVFGKEPSFYDEFDDLSQGSADRKVGPRGPRDFGKSGPRPSVDP